MTENTFRILIVDDEPEILRFLRAALLTHRHAVIEADRGREAIRMIYDQNPDLIILDLGLPDIDGVEVTRRVREWTESQSLFCPFATTRLIKLKLSIPVRMIICANPSGLENYWRAFRW